MAGQLSPDDLDQGYALAAHASPGPYIAAERPDMGPEDPDTGEPGSGWWLDGPGWVSAGNDDEFLMFSTADAAYFAWCEPERVRELIRLARVGMEAERVAGMPL